MPMRLTRWSEPVALFVIASGAVSVPDARGRKRTERVQLETAARRALVFQEIVFAGLSPESIHPKHLL